MLPLSEQAHLLNRIQLMIIKPETYKETLSMIQNCYSVFLLVKFTDKDLASKEAFKMKINAKSLKKICKK